MPVGEDVREVEKEIDRNIEVQKIWTYDRDIVLRAILEHYRASSEIILTTGGWATETNQPEKLPAVFATQRRLDTGVLQAIKWAVCLTKTRKSRRSPSTKGIQKIIEKGTAYEVLVDALKMAAYDRAAIICDRPRRVLTIYEGGNQTGYDNQLVEHQHKVGLFAQHDNLTADEDQLTTRWTAGDYRRTVRRLIEQAFSASTETIVSTLHGVEHPIGPRPVVMEVGQPNDEAEAAVLEDMSFPSPSTMRTYYSWTSWLDSPLVTIDGRRWAMSDVLTTLHTAGEMHMLRLAARADPSQYSRVSQRREDVMTAKCEAVLQQAGWATESRQKLKKPDAEIDLWATKGSDVLVLELKSLMRPLSAWEVYKRNDEVLKGIKQVAANGPRVSATVGVVLTDGYRGDYVTWKESLSIGVPTGTLDDLEDIASRPGDAMALLKERAGFDANQPGSDIGERNVALAGWTLRLMDSQPPAES
jgi:hypothetical protein